MTARKRTVTPYDNTKYSATMPHRYGLQDLVAFLVNLANEGEFDKKGSRRLTMLEHARLVGHGHALTNAVKELTQVLTEGQPGHVQECRLDRFWQALGSAAVIASYQARNPLKERQELELHARGTSEKKKLSQRIDDILIAVTAETSPSWCDYPNRTPWWAAGVILEAARKLFIAEGRKPLGRDAIRRHLERSKHHILSTASWRREQKP